MREKMKRIVTVLLCTLLAFSVVMVAVNRLDAQENQVSYENAVALASQPAETVSAETQPATEPAKPVELPVPQWVPERVEEDLTMLALRGINLDALRQVNPDVVGWISIPETGIHFPVTQGEDNDYYLHHTWDLQSNFAGGIFLESRNNPDLTDFNTIVYGHNMVNGTMFADLQLFEDPDFAAEHPYVYLVTDEGTWRYEIFATYDAPVDSKTYGLSFRQPATRQAFIDHALELSQIRTGITPELTDRILTLSTCNGRGNSARWVVQARLRMVLKA